MQTTASSSGPVTSPWPPSRRSFTCSFSVMPLRLACASQRERSSSGKRNETTLLGSALGRAMLSTLYTTTALVVYGRGVTYQRGTSGHVACSDDGERSARRLKQARAY